MLSHRFLTFYFPFLKNTIVLHPRRYKQTSGRVKYGLMCDSKPADIEKRDNILFQIGF